MNRTSKFLSRALDAGAQCFSALAPRTRASALEWAWSQHASGRCLAAGIGYLRAGTAAPIRVLAFQLRRTSEATGEAFTTRQALRFVAFATAQLKTRPVAEANALIALETLLPLLSSENRSKLHLAFAPLQNVGTFSYLRAGDTSDIPLAVARYRQALKAAQPEPRALGQLACIDPAAARDFLTVSTLDTETAYTHLLLGEDVAHCFEILCRLLPDTVGPVLEQFGHDPAWVESTLARMRAERKGSSADFVAAARARVRTALREVGARPKAIALVSFTNLGRLCIDYLQPFVQYADRYPMVFLVRASKLVAGIDAGIATFYVDRQLLSENHGFELLVTDGSSTFTAIFPDAVNVATVAHGTFTLPAADPYFWADGFSYFDYVFLSGQAAHRDLRDGLSRFRDECLLPHPTPTVHTRRRRQRVHLIPAGHGKIDSLLRLPRELPETKTITFAPTDPASLPPGASAFHGAVRVVEQLLEIFPEHQIVFRPYPNGMEAPPSLETRRRFGSHPRFTFDDGRRTTSEVYRSTSLYLTDASTGGFSFLAATKRPAFFLLPELDDAVLRRFVGEAREEAYVVRSLTEMKAIVDEIVDFTPRADRFIERNLYHPGKAHERLGQILDTLMNEPNDSETWDYVPLTEEGHPHAAR